LSSRYIPAHAQLPLHRKAARLARKHKRVSTVVATAVAAAGIGAVGASSAGATPWADAMNNLATAGHGSSSTAGHATPAFDAVIGQHGRTTGDIQLDARDVRAPGIVGSLSEAVDAVIAHEPAAQHGHAAPATPVPGKPAPARPAPAHAAAARVAPAKAAPAHAAPVHRAPVHVAPPQPYLIYDSVTPTAIPHGPQVATYANGAYAASASEVAGRGHVLWIDTNGSDPNANALDVEPGDATPAGAAAWVQAKLNASHNSVAIVYTMISDWQAVRDNVAQLPQWMQSHVRYWIADPTGYPHVLPGANATQWYWGNSYDITTANPGFQS
jgi:hypothetical protein